METTFMTIHNLTPDANIQFASDSISDVLGYRPDEVIGTSCFDYFHPEEVPIARHQHNRGVQLDKAAVLHYARIKHRNGEWVGCECVFTLTYDVLVACTSIYRENEKSGRRAIEAPAVRRLFSSSPRDPRYHMLEHLSSKFRAPPSQREPRAAIILNRFTRTLTVMYATDAVSKILGVTAEQFKDKSFYECMQENCLPEAIRCLESAKANDSIAYLRFWYRDPRRPEDLEDEEMREASISSDSEDGGVELHGHMDVDAAPSAGSSGRANEQVVGLPQEASPDDGIHQSVSPPSLHHSHGCTFSGESTDLEQNATNAIFDRESASRSSSSSVVVSPQNRRRASVRAERAPLPPPVDPFEIEAVVSCTSDGLVVVLRRARPIIPHALVPAPLGVPIIGAMPMRAGGIFAAPWGAHPIQPHQYVPEVNSPFVHGFNAPVIPAGGPHVDDFMNAIRDVAVFAWSLAGINGNVASYGHGVPHGEAQPPAGLPVWDPYGQSNFLPPVNQAQQRWIDHDSKTNEPLIPNPFDHRREKQLLRQHHGYGHGSMGSDRPGPSAHRYLGSLSGYAFQGPGAYERNQYSNFISHIPRHREYNDGQGNEKALAPSVQQPQNPGHGSAGPFSGNEKPWY